MKNCVFIKTCTEEYFSSSLSNKAEKLHSPIPPKFAVLVARTVISYSEPRRLLEVKKEGSETYAGSLMFPKGFIFNVCKWLAIL